MDVNQTTGARHVRAIPSTKHVPDEDLPAYKQLQRWAKRMGQGTWLVRHEKAGKHQGSKRKGPRPR